MASGPFTSKAAEADAIMKHDEQKGAVVHSFDANASPEEKAAQAGKGRDQLDSIIPKSEESQHREIKMANDKVPPVLPTIVIEDHGDGKAVVAEDTAQVAEDVQQDEAAKVPGAMPNKPAPAIPDWYKVGWRQVSGIDKPPLPEGEERDKGILDEFLSEQFYGSWYHNAGVIVFAVLASHFLTRFNLGWGWIFIVLAFCSTYYTTSMERVRRYARDDIQRELVKTRLASEHETADWINNFLDRFWLIYEPVLSATVVSSVDQILSTNTPAFLDSLRLTHFTLGSKAPRIDKVRTFPKTDDDVVMMDWGISFTPKDTSDMTEKQIADSVNPKITLSVRLGKGLATAALPILVEDISFSGLLRIRLKLISNFPHVQVVDISFLEKPVIGYVLKPIGGETFGFDIANIPGLSSFIRDMTHATLGPLMYDPNVFSLNLEQLLSGKPLDAAIGVVQVNIHSARGIIGNKIGGGTPDPYVSLTINNRAELAKTKYKTNTYNPTWMETKYLLVNSLKDVLTLSVYDFNDHRKNTLMGSATFDFAKLVEDATQEGLVSPLLKEGKERGELRYDVNYFPVLEAEEGKEELQDSTVGIVRLVIHQAKELDHTKSLSGDLNPLAKVYLNSSRSSAFKTSCFKHTNNPVWEAPYEFLCTDKENATITVKTIDDRDFLKDPVIGYMSIKLTDLISVYGQAGKDWFPLSGCKTGRIRLSAEWKPLSMAGALHGSEQYKPPIGVVKLFVEKAADVKNVEATLGGKSDPYVRVQARNVTKGRTEVINNNLNPVWNQYIYIPVHNLKENLMLECMDYQHLTRDRSLGSVELHVADLAIQSSDDPSYSYKSTGVKAVADPIHLDKGGTYKGTLHYTAEFVPALKVKFHKFETASEVSKIEEQRHDDEGGYVSSDGESDGGTPVGITIRSDPKSPIPPTPTTAQTAVSHKKKDSLGNASLASGNPSSPISVNGRESPEQQADTGIEMTQDELLSHQSGIIVFNIISGKLHKKARLEVLLDDGYWPCFSTVKARSTHAQWGYVGEGFMKEVDFGRVWLRLNEADENEKDDVIAEWKGDAKEFLHNTMDGPRTYALSDPRSGDHVSTVMIEARYMPVPVTLDPAERVDNQGVLRVELIGGRDIHGVDRGGKSDPYAVFYLNGEKIFKSQTKKKTLTPEWNETFTVSVPSRIAADFSLEIFDWNQIEQAKSLGVGKINLADIEPFQSQERVINLVSHKHGEKGQIQLRLMFQPEIIAKSRKNTSTFSTAGRAMTQLGGLPVNAGKGVFHGVAGVFKRGDKDSDDVQMAVPADLPAGQSSQPVGISDQMQTATAPFPTNDVAQGPASHEPGTLRVTVLDAKDMSVHDAKAYVTLRLGDKEVKTKHTGKTGTPEWNEPFVLAASAMTPKMYVWVHDHKTIGKDKTIGEGEVDIWRHIKPEGISSADVFVELRQGGLLRMRLEFDASSNPNHTTSGASIHSGERTHSFVSPSRFSLHRRRGNANDSDDS
ncbi:tricalbin [Agrocybe pediades]|nr:tricalbin [Agrocybe pediades]